MVKMGGKQQEFALPWLPSEFEALAARFHPCGPPTWVTVWAAPAAGHGIIFPAGQLSPTRSTVPCAADDQSAKLYNHREGPY